MKPSFRSDSIAGRLTRVNVLVGATALILAFIAFLVIDVISYRQTLIESLGTQAEIIGSNCTSSLLFDDEQTAQTTMSALRNSSSVVSAVLLSADGHRFAVYQRSADSRLPDVPTAQLSGPRTATWTLGSTVLLAYGITSQHEKIGTLYILSETAVLWENVRLYGIIFAFVLLLCLASALVVTSRFRGLLTAPLMDLAQTARVVSEEKDYSIRAKQPKGGDEVASLVASFNEMLHQIQNRDHELQESKEALENRVRERTEELRFANKELEAFSYSVAHDLRGPLDTIGGLEHLLRTSPASELNGEARQTALQLTSAVQRMSDLITDLLNLSRARNAELHREPVDLSELATSILEELRHRDPRRAVEVRIDPGAKVIADRGLMYIVMCNLLSNAWKYSSKVQHSVICFEYSNEDRTAIYTVRDNGTGFDSRFSDRLFRPFERLHTHNEFPGTGVGLATVRRIIERHGGKVWASSQLGKGATFSFSIPVDVHS